MAKRARAAARTVRGRTGDRSTGSTITGVLVAILLLVAGPALAGGAGAGPSERPAEQKLERPDDPPVILVTGSTGGLGREVARSLASRGAHVIVHGRSEERGRELVREIEAAGQGSARFYVADLAYLDEVRELGRSILRDYDRLDVLVNNAGVWVDNENERVLNDAGHELHFAVNYLSHFVLTEMLLPLLRSSAPSRIVNVASVAQRPIDFDDVMMESGYSEGRGYAQSKLAQVLHAYDLAMELEDQGVTVTALHPATMMDTDMVLSRGAAPRTSVDEGVEAVLNLVLSPDIENGRYYQGLNPTRANAQAYDEEARARLREVTRELVGG
jgi:NAD(P)-dependent dehydrogenase (short-subunit alcohol dehydrogenase family)